MLKIAHSSRKYCQNMKTKKQICIVILFLEFMNHNPVSHKAYELSQTAFAIVGVFQMEFWHHH